MRTLNNETLPNTSEIGTIEMTEKNHYGLSTQ